MSSALSPPGGAIDNDDHSPPRRGPRMKYKYRITDPFIFTYGCDLHHRPYTTPKLIERRQVRKDFDPRRYSYRKDHGGLSYIPYQVPNGWEEVYIEETDELLYFNKLTSTFQVEKPNEEADIGDLTSMHYDIDIRLGSTLPSRYPRYLQKRALYFIEEIDILENNYLNKIITRSEYFNKFHSLLGKFDYKRGITYICPLCKLELFGGITECTNEECIKKVAIMRKSNVESRRWIPFLKQKKKYRPETFSSLKRRKRKKKPNDLLNTSSSLNMGSLSGGSSLGANIHLIKGSTNKDKSLKKTKKRKSAKAANFSPYLSSKSSSSSKSRVIPQSRIITTSMSIDDVEHDYIAHRSLDTLNAFNDKVGFSSLPTSESNDLSSTDGILILSTANLSALSNDDSTIGFTMDSKIGATTSEARLVNLHDKHAFVNYNVDHHRQSVNNFNSKLGISIDESKSNTSSIGGSHLLSKTNNASSINSDSSSYYRRMQQNQNDPYLLTRPFQGFNVLDVGEEVEENSENEPVEVQPAIAYFNNMRLGNIFCLWCGAGPMHSRCKGKKCISLHKAKAHVLLPKSVRNLFKRHVGLCKKHNHIFPRGECVGRCPDCGGCNQGDKCQHYNVSGGPKHPSPDGTESWPLCSKTDGSRCFGENFYQIVDPHFNRPPIRIQTAPSSKRSRGKSRSNSMNSASRPSTSSSNSRPSSRGGASSTSSSRPNTSQSTSRPNSKKSTSRPNSQPGMKNGGKNAKFQTKFTPIKKGDKKVLSNTAPMKRPSSRPSSRSSLKRMLNKNNKTISNVHSKNGSRYKYHVRPKSSPLGSLTRKMPKNKKGKSKRTSDSSLILMQNDHQLSLSSAGSSIITDPKIIGEKKIEIRPPFVKKKIKKKKSVLQKKT